MARKASTDKPVSNLETDFNENSTTTVPYPATNTGYLNNEKTTDVLNYYAISLGIGGYANLLRNPMALIECLMFVSFMLTSSVGSFLTMSLLLTMIW